MKDNLYDEPSANVPVEAPRDSSSLIAGIRNGRRYRIWSSLASWLVFWGALTELPVHYGCRQHGEKLWRCRIRQAFCPAATISPTLDSVESACTGYPGWQDAQVSYWLRTPTFCTAERSRLGLASFCVFAFISIANDNHKITNRYCAFNASVGRTAATAVLFNWRRLAQFNRSGAQRRSGNVLAVIVALALMNRPATGPR